MSVLAALNRRAEEIPYHPFIRTEDKVWSYTEFHQETQLFAAYLKDVHLIGPGDRVILCFPNEVEYLIAYFACWYVSAVAMPVDFDIREQTLKRIIMDAKPNLVLYSQAKENLSITGIPGARFPEREEYKERKAAATQGPATSDCALIMYTSGTTGKPKGVMLTHETIAFTARRIIEWAQLKRDNCESTVLRLSHSFGLGHVHCTVLLGSSLYLTESFRDPQRLLRCIEQNGITGFPATPAMIHLLLNYHREAFRETCKSLSYIIINTSPISPQLVRDLLETLPDTRIYMYYGLTEASRSTYIDYRKHPDKLASAGIPPEGVHVRIVEENNEIQIKGPNVMRGYLNEPQSFTEDGWFATGDIGRIDDEGFLFVTGRIKEQINLDGLKINPIEVEEVIRKHPLVQDCIVFGVSDELTFEKVAAVVVCEEKQDNPRALYVDIKKWCKEALEIYKIPRDFQIWSSIPRTDSGKPMRLEARRIWEKGETL